MSHERMSLRGFSIAMKKLFERWEEIPAIVDDDFPEMMHRFRSQLRLVAIDEFGSTQIVPPLLKRVERPVAPGFYYFQYAGAHPNHVWVAQVRRTVINNFRVTIFSDTPDHRRSYVELKSLQGAWWGPLPEPQL